MSKTLYISNGIDIDPSWTKTIVMSDDQVNWNHIPKLGMSIHQTFIQNPNPKTHYPFDTMTRIELRAPDGKTHAHFEIQDIVNQPLWIPLGSEVALELAVSDIAGWL